MTQPTRDASGRFTKRIDTDEDLNAWLRDQGPETPKVPLWAWMLGLAALIIAAALGFSRYG